MKKDSTQAVDDILNLGEEIGKKDQQNLKDHTDWVNFITPLFKAKFNRKYEDQLASWYPKECQKWIEEKRKEFNRSRA